MFSDAFLDYLENFRFTGDIRAMTEGSLFFPDEPVMEVTAPVIEAQVLETFLLNSVGFQTMIASKAARCVHAAAGRALVDFSFRRTHGGEAGIKVARASYLAGFAGTSNLLAGKKYNIPVSGTMAHSYVGAFENETHAFVHFARCFPENAVFLIDTYDTLQGARHAVDAARILEKTGHLRPGGAPGFRGTWRV